jgi:hypothetical protein
VSLLLTLSGILSLLRVTESNLYVLQINTKIEGVWKKGTETIWKVRVIKNLEKTPLLLRNNRMAYAKQAASIHSYFCGFF